MFSAVDVQLKCVGGRKYSRNVESQITLISRKGTNPNYSYELYKFQYLLGIRRFVGTEMIKNLEFVGS